MNTAVFSAEIVIQAIKAGCLSPETIQELKNTPPSELADMLSKQPVPKYVFDGRRYLTVLSDEGMMRLTISGKEREYMHVVDLLGMSSNSPVEEYIEACQRLALAVIRYASSAELADLRLEVIGARENARANQNSEGIILSSDFFNEMNEEY